MKILKRILIVILSIIVIMFIAVLISLVIIKIKTNKMLDDYSKIYSNEKYNDAFLIDNVQVFEQNISCGYAVIEMFAKWNNNSNITEKKLI